MADSKTNAARLFDKAGLPYTLHAYGSGEFCDGVAVAKHLGLEPARVFKTLVTTGHSGEHYVFVIPVDQELHLKKAASAVGEKSIAMLPMKDLQKVTGYVRGGCSPFAMKKQLITVFDETAILFDTIFVSAGRIGVQLEAKAEDMVYLAQAAYADLTIA